MIFIGVKNETIRALVELIKLKVIWTDNMDQAVGLVTMNTNDDNGVRTMTQREFPFRILDIPLPQCNTGFVYFVISIWWENIHIFDRRFAFVIERSSIIVDKVLIPQILHTYDLFL